MSYISEFFDWVVGLDAWKQFDLIEAQPPSSGSIFGFSEFLAALALFLVVMTASDFRYRYRLLLARTDLRKLGFWVSLLVGLAILAVDVWFQNGLPVPVLLSNANNLKTILALILLTMIVRVVSVAVFRPPTFTKSNARQFFDANYRFVHEGNVDRLQVIAEELCRSISGVLTHAAGLKPKKDRRGTKVSLEQAIAHDFLLLIADRRFCKVVVEKVPAFPLICFQEAQKQKNTRLPIFQFARNVGQEFLRNTHSSFYQEDSGYSSGFLGYARPVTSIIFGSYEFIERCAQDGGSPLEADYRDLCKFDGTQMDGLSRASLTFLEKHLEKTSGRQLRQSYALGAVWRSFEYSLHGTYQLNGMESFDESPAYERLRVTVEFIRKAAELLDKHSCLPIRYRVSKGETKDTYDRLAQLVILTILAASSVASPVWTAWFVQYNTVWSPLFTFADKKAQKILALKVRRLMYEEIKGMDTHPDFQGARILGYCLNVLGLAPINRHKGLGKEFYPLQAAALRWTKANFGKLLAHHPKVAPACLQGSVSYDAENRRLVKTYSRETGLEPPRDFLYFD